MGFLNDLEIETSVTSTENGGRALSSTGDGLLNLFCRFRCIAFASV